MHSKIALWFYEMGSNFPGSCTPLELSGRSPPQVYENDWGSIVTNCLWKFHLKRNDPMIEKVEERSTEQRNDQGENHFLKWRTRLTFSLDFSDFWIFLRFFWIFWIFWDSMDFWNFWDSFWIFGIFRIFLNFLDWWDCF